MTMIHLYVKTHRGTGMKYFGKTSKDPVAYRGSGALWKRHLRKHGNDVVTSVVASFDDETQRDDLMQFALSFSREHDIVALSEWANLIEEDGLAGKPIGSPGYVPNADQRRQHSLNSRAMWQAPDFRAKVGAAQAVAWANPERRAALAEVMRNQPESQRQAQSERMKRYHRDAPEGAWEIGRLPKSAKHREAIAAALRGRPKSPEHRAALRAAALRRRKLEAIVPDIDRP